MSRTFSVFAVIFPKDFLFELVTDQLHGKAISEVSRDPKSFRCTV